MDFASMQLVIADVVRPVREKHGPRAAGALGRAMLGLIGWVERLVAAPATSVPPPFRDVPSSCPVRGLLFGYLGR